MSAELLRQAAASIRGEVAAHEYMSTEEPFFLAVADWLDAEAQAHVHVPGSDRAKPVYDMPGMDKSPAARVAAAYLNQELPAAT